MRPALPLLPLPCPSFPPSLPPPSPPSSSPRRPPTPPKRQRLSTTWGSVVAARTARSKSPIRADIVAVALLAAEARRRGGIVARERLIVGRKGQTASPLLKSRVRLLEKDANEMWRTMIKHKLKVKAQLKKGRKM